jgi:hypothetical protein
MTATKHTTKTPDYTTNSFIYVERWAADGADGACWGETEADAIAAAQRSFGRVAKREEAAELCRKLWKGRVGIMVSTNCGTTDPVITGTKKLREKRAELAELERAVYAATGVRIIVVIQ